MEATMKWMGSQVSLPKMGLITILKKYEDFDALFTGLIMK